MSLTPVEINLEFSPDERFAVVDLSDRIPESSRDALSRYRRVMYCSLHTTAGFLEQGLCSRLNGNGHAAPQPEPEGLRTFIRVFQRLFPPNADYRHDALHLRTELTEAERRLEPRNADSHLTFIGSGLRSCVTYTNPPKAPVYFIELDGVCEGRRRQRQAVVIGYNRQELVRRFQIAVPMSDHPVDSVNLKDERIGLMGQLQALVNRDEIEKGRIDISLDPAEQQTALTVNEYETLLMRHDLTEVLQDPLRFIAEKSKHMVQDPQAIPSKALNYAKYDLVQVLNELLDTLGMSGSLVERVLDRFLAVPVSHRLRMKRSVSLTVSDGCSPGRGTIVQGRYQSPILMQWRANETRTRRLNVALYRFL